MFTCPVALPSQLPSSLPNRGRRLTCLLVRSRRSDATLGSVHVVRAEFAWKTLYGGVYAAVVDHYSDGNGNGAVEVA
jgi:hypothetical protein